MKRALFAAMLGTAVLTTGLSQAAMAESGQETITLFRQNDGNGAVEAVIEAFEEAYPEYTINWVEATNDTDQIRAQLNTAFSAGSSEYDVIAIDTVWAGDMAAAGYIEPLDSYLKDSGRSVSEFNKGGIQAGTYAAKTYALPVQADTAVLFFRKDIVSEEDAAVLRSGDYTWNDLLEMSEKYQGQGGTSCGMTFQANQYEGLICCANEFTANFQNVSEGLEMMKAFVDSDTTPDDILVYQEDQACTSFLNGECVFSRNWPYVWGYLGTDENLTEDQVDVAPLPDGDCVGGWLLAMNANSEHKDAAWAFMNFFTSAESAATFSALGGYVPGTTAAQEDPELLEANKMLATEGFTNALDNSIARPSSDDYQTLSDALQIEIHKYLSGNAELDATVEAVEELLS